MLKIISHKDFPHYPALLLDHFRLRHREFMVRQQYAAHVVDGMEFDQYDTLASIFLVYTEDGETALGCSRLSSIAYGCMLKDHFSDLVDDKTIFEAPNIWEGTRFCIDKRLSPEKRLQICYALCAGYLQVGLDHGVDRIIGLMPTAILRSVFERSGVILDRLGKVTRIGDHARVQAAAIAVNRQQLQRIHETATSSGHRHDTFRHVA